MSKTDITCNQPRKPSLVKRLRLLWLDNAGFTAAESALLALVLCGICIMVGNIIYPAAKQAAKRLNAEIAGR